MRLHYLEFEGIGPFRDRTRINFDDLGASRLFLLEGPTGSGKSTIIDAIVFALYGSVASSDASEQRIRSQFSPPDKPSYAELFFEVPDGLFRIRRTPAYHRAKSRGTGTTRQNATVHLWRLHSPQAMHDILAGNERASDAQPLASRTDDAGAAIQRLIGLSRDQFTQTVVLPQGEFARFLKANSEERKRVLTKVFGTGLYENLEAEFVQARIEAKRESERSLALLAQALTRVSEAAGHGDEEAAALESAAAGFTDHGIEAITETVRNLEHDAHARAHERHSAAQQALHARDQAEKARDAARTAHALMERRHRLDTTIATSERQAPAVNQARERLHAHEAAEAAFYALAALDKAQRQQDSVASHLPDDLRSTPEHWSHHLSQARETYESLTKEAAALGPLLEREQALKQLRTTLDEARARVEKTSQDVTTAAALLDDRPRERAQLNSDLASARDQAAEWDKANEASQRARTRAEAGRTIHTLENEHHALSTRLDAAAHKARTAIETETRVRQARIDDIAGELASELREDEPCPVCGSHQHPQPAQRRDAAVSAEAVNHAERDRRAAETALAQCKQEFDMLSARIATSRESIGAHDSDIHAFIEQAQADLADALSALETATTARTAVSDLEASLARFEEETEQLSRRLNEAKIAHAHALEQHDSTSHLIESEHATLEQARDEHASIQDKQRHLVNLAAAQRDLIERLSAAHNAKIATEDAAERSSREIDTSIFASAHDVRAARLSSEQREASTTVIEEAAALTAWIDQESADPDLAHIEATEQARTDSAEHLTRSEQAFAEAQDTHTQAQSAHDTAVRVHERLASAATHLRAHITRHENDGARNTAIVRLCDIVTGGSRDAHFKLPLSSYVVMRRFEKVIEAANARLATLADGTLELTQAELGSKRGKEGLGLDVIDRRTDQRREPATLSGGETFYVSLALALGLADIVRAESGGIELNTLFIDEGFGSLDPEKLDGVIAEIRALAQHGRTVGIVSHVAELKTQIAEKIHVSRNEEGIAHLHVTS